MAVVRTDLRKAPERTWTPPQESRDGRVSSIAQLTAAKVSNPKFRGKAQEILSTFQRAFLNRECASSNPPRSFQQFLVGQRQPQGQLTFDSWDFGTQPSSINRAARLGLGTVSHGQINVAHDRLAVQAFVG